MPSELSWIDYSTKEREASMQALALLKTSDSRDELGIGAIRDTLSDIMFPGTSTLHTRIKYFLFIPWMYKTLEDENTKGIYFYKRADKRERDLIEILKKEYSDSYGVIGYLAGRNLKNLPSTMYWSGLKNWGIFEMDKSRGEYHDLIDLIYKARRDNEKSNSSRRSRQDDWQDDRHLITKTWNEGLPPVPDSFPKNAKLELTYEEAQYLQDRIILKQKDSLLAYLVTKKVKSDANHPIEHILFNQFSDRHKYQVKTAYKFSLLIQGAALLYNLMLAEKSQKTELIEKYDGLIDVWEAKLPLLNDWNINELWELVVFPESAHNVSHSTKIFVESWLELTKNRNIKDSGEARECIFKRETSLKRAKSRFASAHMLDIWGGSSGVGFIENRWGIARTLINDLCDGLEGESDA